MSSLGLNKVILMGVLGDNPKSDEKGEAITLKSGCAYTRFSLAIHEYRKDSNDEGSVKTEWINIVCFDKNAQNACRYLKKGSTVHIEGKLRTRSYDAENGQRKFITEIVCDPMGLIFVGSKDSASNANIQRKVDTQSCFNNNAYEGSYINRQNNFTPAPDSARPSFTQSGTYSVPNSFAKAKESSQSMINAMREKITENAGMSSGGIDDVELPF